MSRAPRTILWCGGGIVFTLILLESPFFPEVAFAPFEQFIDWARHHGQVGAIGIFFSIMLLVWWPLVFALAPNTDKKSPLILICILGAIHYLGVIYWLLTYGGDDKAAAWARYLSKWEANPIEGWMIAAVYVIGQVIFCSIVIRRLRGKPLPSLPH